MINGLTSIYSVGGAEIVNEMQIISVKGIPSEMSANPKFVQFVHSLNSYRSRRLFPWLTINLHGKPFFDFDDEMTTLGQPFA